MKSTDELVTPLTATGSCDIVTDVAQKYPIPIMRAARHGPPLGSPIEFDAGY